jgi:hypothetical protein
MSLSCILVVIVVVAVVIFIAKKQSTVRFRVYNIKSVDLNSSQTILITGMTNIAECIQCALGVFGRGEVRK